MAAPVLRTYASIMEPEKRGLTGAIETIATLIVVLAIVAFVVWFLFFAHDPLLRV
jgi:hypothetical protein